MTRIIVRTCEGREEYLGYLQRHIEDLEVCRDTKRCPMDTMLRSFDMAGDDAAVIVEDDIVLTQGFRDKLEAEIRMRPSVVIQFFSMRGADLTEGSRYDRRYIAALCSYFPAGYCRAIAEYYRTIWSVFEQVKNPTGADLVVTDFLRSRREPYWIHIPNIVDHRVGKSMIDSRRSSKRVSKTFKDPIDDV